jgi:hypothetical protein
MATTTIEPYDAIRAGYANLITDMTREQLTHQAFFLHRLAWERGEQAQELRTRLAAAERVIAVARQNAPPTYVTMAGQVRCRDCGGINGHTDACPSGRQLAAIEAHDQH